MNRIAGWIRVGLVDLRGDLRRFGVLIACLALGTSVIAAVGSVGAGLNLAIERDASSMLGGDLETMRPDRDATDEELLFLQTLGEVAHVVDTNARGATEGNSAFIDLLAAGETYPLRGNVISPQLPLGEKPAQLLQARDGAYGALVDPVLFDKLEIGIGDGFRVGGIDFDVRGTLTSVPDGAVRGFQYGLTVMISTEALGSMTDLRPPLPGLLTQHRYKIMLGEATYPEAALAIQNQFNDEDWRTRSPRDAAGDLVRYYDLFASFLLIVGLSSLLVGGVGVSNGVSAYINERQRSIATLRSMGATSARILVHFLTQIMVLTSIGVGIGVLFGGLASLAIMPLVGSALNVNLPSLIEPGPLLVAAGFGYLAGFAFSYMPLMRAQKVRTAMLFRSLGSTLPPLGWRAYTQPSLLLPILIAAIGIGWLAILTTDDVALVAFYALGVVVSFLLLRASGWVLLNVLRVLAKVGIVSVRHALRNIYRPGSSAPSVIVSIGLALAMLLVIALLNTNLNNQLLGAVSQDAPTFVATDLFDDEVEALEQMALDDPNMAFFSSDPMLRGAVLSVNGVDIDSFENLPDEAAPLLNGEIPITWTRDLPADGTLTDGTWWPSDYSGNPLISLSSDVQQVFGLRVGDRIAFRMFGETVEAEIANFREYKWQAGINFLVTFSPGYVDFFPSTFLGSIKAAEGQEKELERTLGRTFPVVSFLPIGDALNQLAGVLSQLGMAVNVVGGLAVINGILVLGGTMAAGRKQRELDAIIQKVLGATRLGILWVFIMEYGLLGAFAALIASLLGIVAAWAITYFVLGLDFSADVGLIVWVVLGAVAMTVATGAFTTWRALSSRPAQVLRDV